MLGVDPQDVIPGRRLQEMGMESFLAVRLHLRLAERTGVRVPLEAFVGATLEALTAEVEKRRGADISPEAVAPATVTVNGSVAQGELTPIQASYWVGREADLPLGGVATYFYFEYDRSPGEFVVTDPVAEIAKLETAWNRLIVHHDMLRAAITDDGRQRVLPPGQRYSIGVTDLRGRADAEDSLAELRREKSHTVHNTTVWPFPGPPGT